jgi:hypothetical protein
MKTLLPLLPLLQVCRLVIDAARQAGKRVVLVRHPMVRLVHGLRFQREREITVMWF